MTQPLRSSIRFGSPTEILSGPGSRAHLAAEIMRLAGRRVLVVSDEGLAAAGVLTRVTDVLEHAPLPYRIDVAVPTDPTFLEVDRLSGIIRDTGIDTVVAVGSGSVLAAGRAAAVAAPQAAPTHELARTGRFEVAPLLSICVPTTAGSGGEVSRQATLTDEAGHKSGLQGWPVAARLAILDAELLTSVPRRQAVASGIDALTHALEAYVSRRATPLTDALALPAFETIVRDLPAAVAGPSDVVVLDRLLLASTMANLACGNAGLGLVHGLNKGITYLFHTGRYEGVSYGDLHAVLLPWVDVFNIPAAPARFARLARLLGVTEDGSDEEIANLGTERLKAWLAGLDAPRRLPWDGCPPDDMALIFEDVLGRAMARDNPRDSTAPDLEAIVKACIAGWA